MISPSNHPDELVKLVISLAEDEGVTPRGAANKIWRAAGRDHNRISETTREAIIDLGDDMVAGDPVAIRVLAILHLAESRIFNSTEKVERWVVSATWRKDGERHVRDLCEPTKLDQLGGAVKKCTEVITRHRKRGRQIRLRRLMVEPDGSDE